MGLSSTDEVVCPYFGPSNTKLLHNLRTRSGKPRDLDSFAHSHITVSDPTHPHDRSRTWRRNTEASSFWSCAQSEWINSPCDATFRFVEWCEQRGSSGPKDFSYRLKASGPTICGRPCVELPRRVGGAPIARWGEFGRGNEEKRVPDRGGSAIYPPKTSDLPLVNSRERAAGLPSPKLKKRLPFQPCRISRLPTFSPCRGAW